MDPAAVGVAPPPTSMVSPADSGAGKASKDKLLMDKAGKDKLLMDKAGGDKAGKDGKLMWGGGNNKHAADKLNQSTVSSSVTPGGNAMFKDGVDKAGKDKLLMDKAGKDKLAPLPGGTEEPLR